MPLYPRPTPPRFSGTLNSTVWTPLSNISTLWAPSTTKNVFFRQCYRRCYLDRGGAPGRKSCQEWDLLPDPASSAPPWAVLLRLYVSLFFSEATERLRPGPELKWSISKLCVLLLLALIWHLFLYQLCAYMDNSPIISIYCCYWEYLCHKYKTKELILQLQSETFINPSF